LVADEAGFKRDGIVNYHNSHLCPENNLHTSSCKPSTPFFYKCVDSNNRGRFIRPFRIQGGLTGASYLTLC
jgi:hypothetical protein